MAQVQPPLNPDTITPRSEGAVYRALRNQLDDAYEVIYSQDVTYLNNDHNRRYGEIDFVVWHPRYGMVVLEVKGGAEIEKNGQGVWRSRRHDDGTWHTISNPFQQAQQAMYTLKDELEHRVGHALQFPHTYACVFPGAMLTSDVPVGEGPESCIDASRMDTMASAVKGTLASVATAFNELNEQKRQQRTANLQTVWDTLTDAFQMIPAGDVEGASTRKGTIERGRKIFYQLTEEQARLYYDTLQSNRRMLVRGPAGTGKTLLAVNRAKQLAKEGKRTLLLCYNRLLAKHLAEQTEEITNLDTRYFHEIIERNIVHTSRHRMPTNPESSFWIEESADLLLDIVEAKGTMYDALVVDEAQDIYPDWWQALQFLLVEDPHVYVFADMNQNIYGPQLSVDTVWDDMPLVRVVQNCRSVQRIAEYAADLRGVASLLHHPSLEKGIPVEERSYHTPDEEVEVLDALVRELREQGVESNQIILLAMHRKEHTALANHDRLAGYALKQFDMEHPPTNQELSYSTAQRFKGLDAPVVIVHGLDADCDYSTHLNFMYVACTRAQERLYLVHHDDWSPPAVQEDELHG